METEKPVFDEGTKIPDGEKLPVVETVRSVFDENPKILDGEKLPVHDSIKVLRYRTLKKNTALGWWSAVVLLYDHEKMGICFYRWRRKSGEWKRDKKLPFKSRAEWEMMKSAVESLIGDLPV